MPMTHKSTEKMPAKIAFFQQLLALYRKPIFQLLTSDEELLVTFFAPTQNNYSSVKSIAPSVSMLSPAHGGLRWSFIRNIQIGNFCWQTPSVFNHNAIDCDVYVLQGSVYHLSSWVLSIFAWMRGKKVVMWTHGFLRNESGVKNIVRTLFYSLADALLLYGDRSKEFLRRRGFHENQLHVIYNSLDYRSHCQIYSTFDESITQSVKRRFFRDPKLPLLLFIGRLTQQKKLDQIIHALKLLSEKGSRFNAIFVGDGPEFQRLTTLTDDFSLSENVHFFGPCYDDNITAELIYAADACVSPGEVGLTAIHSLSFGTPVITHGDLDNQMPEVEAITHSYNGMLYERGSVESLANAIVSWTENNSDRGDVRRRCRNIIDSKYNPHYQLEVFKRAISQVLQESPSEP